MLWRYIHTCALGGDFAEEHSPLLAAQLTAFHTSKPDITGVPSNAHLLPNGDKDLLQPDTESNLVACKPFPGLTM